MRQSVRAHVRGLFAGNELGGTSTAGGSQKAAAHERVLRCQMLEALSLYKVPVA